MSRTIGADVPEDSDISNRFDDFVDERSMNSNAEAVRQLLYAGLNAELGHPGDRDTTDAAGVFGSLELTILGAAFLVGAGELLAAGLIGTVLFAAIGTLLVLLLTADVVKRTAAAFGWF